MTQQPNSHSGGPRRVQRRQRPTPRDRKKREKIIMVVMIILAVIMVLAATLVVLYQRWVQKPTLPTNDNPSASAPAVSLAPGESEAPLDIDAEAPLSSGERKSKDFYTILVFGADETSGLTDTIMVVSYDVTNQKATVMSIPRDTLVNSSARDNSKKINAAYTINGGGESGIAGLKERVADLVGFVPDFYVMIDWELVGQMVDAIGGVYFEVPFDMFYDDFVQGLKIDLKAGYQLLNGDQAMQLVRWRKNMDRETYEIIESVGDVGRLDIQHDFLKAVLSQTLQLKNVTRIGQLAQLFGENVVSDLTIENLFWFGSQAIFGGLNVDDVEFVTMPWRSGTDYRGNSYVFPIRSQLLELINESLNPYVEEVPNRQLDLMSVNSDGTLSSSTGRLADSSMGVLPATPEPSPSTSPDPDASQDPNASPSPGASNAPAESGQPEVSPSPGVSDAPAASQSPAPGGESAPPEPPAESDAPVIEQPPAQSQAPAHTTPAEPDAPPQPDTPAP